METGGQFAGEASGGQVIIKLETGRWKRSRGRNRSLHIESQTDDEEESFNWSPTGLISNANIGL